MANIKMVYICPRCSEGITSLHDEVDCPSCGLALGKKGTPPYTPPLTLDEQHVKYEDKALLVQSVLGLRHEKMMAMLQDALSIIELISAKKCPITDIRPVLELGVRIGKVAESYDNYLRSGGQHVPAVLLTIEEAKKRAIEQPPVHIIEPPALQEKKDEPSIRTEPGETGQ